MLTSQEILDTLTGIADVNQSVIDLVLADAKNQVLNDGILETNAMFDLLHKYYTMHLLQVWGHVEDISSEEAGDVKSTYSKTAPAAGESKWLIEYQRELAKIGT